MNIRGFALFVGMGEGKDPGHGAGCPPRFRFNIEPDCVMNDTLFLCGGSFHVDGTEHQGGTA
jgi:hypothetical protein